MMDVNVASMFLTCRAVVPGDAGQGGGTIVNISSGTPFRGVPFLLHYVTSKGAIVAFTRALAKELGKDGVRVNCVAPGFTMSDGVKQHPEVVEKLREASVAARTIQRDQVPEDVVGAVVYLAGPSLGVRHRPDHRHRRRPVLPLRFSPLRASGRGRDRTPATASSTTSAAGEAYFGAARVDGPRARLGARRDGERRCSSRARSSSSPPRGLARALRPDRLPARRDRVPAHASRRRDPAPPARSSSRSTHAGELAGYGPGGVWFERADDPVLATASARGADGVRARAAPARPNGRASGRSAISTRRRGEAEAPAAHSVLRPPLSSAEARDDSAGRPDPRRPAGAARRRPRLRRARRELPRGARRARRLADPLHHLPRTRSAPRTWPRRTESSPAAPGSASSRAGPGATHARGGDPHRLPGLDAAAPADRPGRARRHARARRLPGDRLPADVRADGEVGRADRRGEPDPGAASRAPSTSRRRGGRGRSCSRCPRTCSSRRPTSPTPRRTGRPRRHPDAADLARMRELLAGATRPLVIVGGHPWSAAAHDAARRLGRGGPSCRSRRVGAARTRRQHVARLRRAPRPRPRSAARAARRGTRTCSSSSATGSATSRPRATRYLEMPQPDGRR